MSPKQEQKPASKPTVPLGARVTAFPQEGTSWPTSTGHSPTFAPATAAHPRIRAPVSIPCLQHLVGGAGHSLGFTQRGKGQKEGNRWPISWPLKPDSPGFQFWLYCLMSLSLIFKRQMNTYNSQAFEFNKSMNIEHVAQHPPHKTVQKQHFYQHGC